jgi:nitrate/TMAO reductase-like tetraheme cytochrome c subunit
LSERREYRHNPVKRPWYRSTWFTWVVVIAIAAIFVGILVWPVAAMDNATYCTSCKAMQPQAKTLALSAHNGIDCTECHIPPGKAEAVKWRLREARNIWADYLGMPTTAQKGSVPTNANCLKCHPLDKIPNEGHGVRMNHAEHLDRNLNCVDCHSTVSHRLPGQKELVSMVTCLMCHSERGTAPSDCGFCHPVPDKSKHAPDFMEDHGVQAEADPQSCLRCHHDKAKFCDSCHSYPPPSHFSGTWRYEHALPAKTDPANCEACHDKAFCNQCHQVDHPDDWVQKHGAIAAKGPQACLVCHPRSMCDACHLKEGVEAKL